MKYRRGILTFLIALALTRCSHSTTSTSPSAAATGAPSGTVSMVDESALDRTAQPCEDFYQFACGGWIQKTEIPADRPAWSRGFYEIAERNQTLLREILERKTENDKAGDTKALEKLRTYYSVCMDEAKAETDSLKALRMELGAIDAIRTKEQLPKLLAELHLKGSNAFFNYGNFQDFKNSSQMIAIVDQGGLGLPDRDYYLKDEGKMPEARKYYREYIGGMAKALGISSVFVKPQADVILKMETELAKASMARADRREPEKVYHRLELEGLQKLTPKFNWPKYFSTMGQPDVKEINVAVPEFMSAVAKVIDSNNIRDIKTYLRWTMVRHAAPMLGKKFVNERFRFTSRALSGEKQILPRWKRCITATEGAMGELLGKNFVEVTFGKEGKDLSRQIIHSVEAAFEKNLSTLDWMDETTKKAATAKLKKLVNQIGYPDKWRNFDGLVVDKKSYLENALRAEAFNQKYELAKIGKPVDRTEWYMPPQMVNAYYSAENNQMVFPAGILQKPFFDRTARAASNYGAVGMVMGHELTHGFDDQGKQFDENGNLANWWTANVGKEFTNRAACLVDQYSGYVPVDALHLNGKLTLGENIADQGGIKLAYEAFQSARQGSAGDVAGFNDDQQFFLSFAQSWCTKQRPELQRTLVTVDPHSPARFRVNGPLSNYPKFAEAFQCKAGAKMAPAKRCSVW